MKRYFFLPVLFALVLVACDHDWKYIVITNNSGHEVTFKFKDVEGAKTLPAGESLTFDSYWTTQLDYYTPEKRVSYSYTSDYDSVSGIFENRPSIELRVENTLNVPATLSADGWMDKIENLPSGESRIGKIFTDKPVFSVSTAGGFPATAQYQIINSVMYVTIK